MNSEQQQLRDYVLSRMKQGVSTQKITHEMMQNGWEAQALQPVIIDAQRLFNQHAPTHKAHKQKLAIVSGIVVVVVVAGLILGQLLASSFNEAGGARQQGDIQVVLADAEYARIDTPSVFSYSISNSWQVAAEPFFLDSLGTYTSSYFNYDRSSINEELLESGAINRASDSLISVEPRELETAPFSIDEMYEVQVKVEPKSADRQVGVVESVRLTFADSPDRQVEDLQSYLVNGKREVADYIVNNDDDTLLDQRRIRFFSADGTMQAEIIVNRTHSLKVMNKTDFTGLLELVSSVAF